MNRRRILSGSVAVACIAAVMLVAGTIAGGSGGQSTQTPVAAGPVSVGTNISVGDATQTTSALQARLRKFPTDWASWSTLGYVYTQQARLTADPSFYGKAGGAFAQSLKIRPAGNASALTGQGSLAAARHDFGRALTLAQAADRVDKYSAANLGVMTDALSELGRYPEAMKTLQRMVDLKPGVPSYTRVSYSYELRGDLEGAKFALTSALEVAQTPADAGFTLRYLGELAFNAGDLPTAKRHFADGLQRDPTYLPLLAGQARVEAASGDTDAALRTWQQVTTALPEPAYLIEYADLLAALGRTDEATRQYAVVDATTRLFREQGSNVDLELALYDADRGRAQDALRSAQAEINRRASIHVQDAYAWALHGVGRDKEALVHARKAQQTGMRNALFAYHRGIIEQSLGMKAQARASLTSALAINPHFSPLQAPKAKAALAGLGGPSTP